ncbi:Anti-sigma factor antagonist [Acidobacteriia bacterium SbA2]|nr:Anti-sigma factor antagonist [Acidobacteriia bacterium SbA2]
MSIELITHEKGEVMIVDVSGRLTLGEGTSALRKRMRELVEGGSRQIVLNMTDVTYMDSSGLGELVAAYTTVTTTGGELKLSNLARRVHELLFITKLCTVFESFEDEASAIASFSVAKPTELQAQI